MGRNIFAFTCISLFVAACGASVDVGGPRADGGSAGSGGSSVGKGGSVSTTPGGASQASAGNQTTTGGTVTTPPLTPDMVSATPAPCKLDSDCCLVTDSCFNRAYVVGKDSRDEVRALIDGEDKSRCTGCIAPIVAVSCQNSRCVGVEVPYDSNPDPILAQDHCGSVPSNDSQTTSGGAPSDTPDSSSSAGAPGSAGAAASDPSTPPTNQTAFGCGVPM